MKIYTKKGDKGITSLFGGRRVQKDILRVEAYGTVDELNSLIGFVRTYNKEKEIDEILGEIQDDLFTLGTDLAAPAGVKSGKVRRVGFPMISRLERQIDTLELKVKPLANFILPGGNRASALLHLARTVCRRAERVAVRLARREPLGEPVLIYLNRLSDLLFMLARWSNTVSRTPEKKWNFK